MHTYLLDEIGSIAAYAFNHLEYKQYYLLLLTNIIV